MRQDARSLLERLSRKEFNYQEFEDPFTDMDLWPIFEALLTDERVVGPRASSLREADVQVRERRTTDAAEQDARQPTRRIEKVMRAEKASPRAGLFDRYGSTSGSSRKPVNMRTFLDRLSDKD